MHTGQVFASTPATTGLKPFMDLAGQVMARPGYNNAPRVFVIAGNGPDHRGQAAIGRLAKAHPDAIMICTPLHPSWLNQTGDLLLRHPEESDHSRRLRQPRTTLCHPAGLCRPHNQTARQFSWKFTASDLHHLMDRISRHEQQDDPQDQPLPQAA